MDLSIIVPCYNGVPPYRFVLSRGFSAIYRFLVNWHVHTYTSSFRAYRQKVVRQVSFESSGYLAGTELLANGILTGFRVIEHPTVLHSRVLGTSKAKLARTILAHLKFQTQVLLRRLHLMPSVEPREVRGQKRA
jgi:dolichol-phosphate mannosyltransferase